MKGRETRARIFRAALRLASRDGLLTLTLDNVAEEAGLSKGGVMHHFASKEALLRGVIAHFSEQIEGRLMRLVADDPKPSFRWLRAMLALTRPSEETSPETEESEVSEGLLEAAQKNGDAADSKSSDRASQSEGVASPEELERFMLSVLAAAVHNPELTEPIRTIGQRLRGRLTAVPEEGIEPLVMWLVMDGLFLWQFVGLIQRDDPLIGELRRWLEDRERELSAGLRKGQSYARRRSKVEESKVVSKRSASEGVRRAEKLKTKRSRARKIEKESRNGDNKNDD